MNGLQTELAALSRELKATQTVLALETTRADDGAAMIEDLQSSLHQSTVSSDETIAALRHRVDELTTEAHAAADREAATAEALSVKEAELAHAKEELDSLLNVVRQVQAAGTKTCVGGCLCVLVATCGCTVGVSQFRVAMSTAFRSSIRSLPSATKTYWCSCSTLSR